ncbi:MAG: folate-binding protein YgfZ [Sterolibacterium sp.]|jgi:folate-binding protein YgfZ|nr:folate-binding protein YgfZ [Sterolibacterium sp.]
MNQEWNDFLAQQGATSNATELRFAAPADEVKQAQSGAILVPLTDLGLIRASGPDSATFLHNLLTNDVEALPPDGAGRYGFCTPKGRLLATFLMWREGDDYLLAVAADLHAAMLKKLSMYVLRSKVKLTDASHDRVLLGLAGTQAQTLLGSFGALPTTSLRTTIVADSCVIRLGEERYLMSIPATQAQTRWSALRAELQPAGLAAWRWLDIVTGIPQITLATQEEFTPQMVNYELIGGVSFKKGCYPGQEIVARTQYLGKVKRRMYRAHLETGTPAPGNPLFTAETGDQPCGMIVTAAPAPQGGHDVLAVIQSAYARGAALHLGSPDGAMLQIRPLPYALGD